MDEASAPQTATMDMPEIAKYTGIGLSTLYRMKRALTLPLKPVWGTNRYARRHVDEWLAGKRAY